MIITKKIKSKETDIHSGCANIITNNRCSNLPTCSTLLQSSDSLKANCLDCVYEIDNQTCVKENSKSKPNKIEKNIQST